MSFDRTASDEVRRLVDEYCSTQRNPSLPKFLARGPFSLKDSSKSDVSNKPGCYAIYGDGGQLRYIGMSLANVGDRIGSHFSAATQRSTFWQDGPPAGFIDVVEVLNPWEAPSLEQYLISRTREIVHKATP